MMISAWATGDIPPALRGRTGNCIDKQLGFHVEVSSRMALPDPQELRPPQATLEYDSRQPLLRAETFPDFEIKEDADGLSIQLPPPRRSAASRRAISNIAWISIVTVLLLGFECVLLLGELERGVNPGGVAVLVI